MLCHTQFILQKYDCMDYSSGDVPIPTYTWLQLNYMYRYKPSLE